MNENNELKNLKNEKKRKPKKMYWTLTWKRVHKKSLYHKFYAIFFRINCTYILHSLPLTIYIGWFVRVCVIGIFSIIFFFIQILHDQSTTSNNFNRLQSLESSTGSVDENWFSLHWIVHPHVHFFRQFNQKIQLKAAQAQKYGHKRNKNTQ